MKRSVFGTIFLATIVVALLGCDMGLLIQVYLADLFETIENPNDTLFTPAIFPLNQVEKAVKKI